MDKSTDQFINEMRDVKPLKQEKRILLDRQTADNRDKETLAARKRSAEQVVTSSAHDPLADAEVTQLEANAVLAFQRPGVQHGVYRQLRLGKYSVEARLDLHRMRVEESRMTVYQFVRDCIANDIRCALITHGKGEGRDKPAVLKSYVAHWLPQITEVLAFHSAQKHHGGTGATYIMLKKSERKRQENLEKHQNKRS